MSEADNLTNSTFVAEDEKITPLNVPAFQPENSTFSSSLAVNENNLAALAPYENLEKLLLQKLEAFEQAAQRQQILIETLTTRLEISQERVAQLEQECATFQASYNEQSHQLVQTENTCRELRTRLIRQQRQTLQFKVALEKCLEPAPSYQSQANSDISATAVSPQSFSIKAQPIQPWSAQLPSFGNELEPTSEIQTFNLNLSDEDLSTNAEQEFVGLEKAAFVAPLTEQPELAVTSPSPLLAESPLTKSSDSAPSLQSETVAVDPNPDISKLSNPKGGYFSVTTDLEEHYSLTEDTSESEEEDWQDLVSLLEAIDEQLNAYSPAEATTMPSPDVQPPAQLNESLMLDTDFESVLPNKVIESPQQETEFLTPNSNWPSPTLYPLLPSKGIKSLAAIELPTFAPKSTNQEQQVRTEESEKSGF